MSVSTGRCPNCGMNPQMCRCPVVGAPRCSCIRRCICGINFDHIHNRTSRLAYPNCPVHPPQTDTLEENQ